jgi:hypothetical protein
MRFHLPAVALAAACGLGLAAPARAAELDKYLPEDAGFYVHVNVQQLLTAPVVRKAIPMAVQKYGDQVLPLVQFAKLMNPDATKDIRDEDVKKAINELKKPETVANAFDAAKDVLTDIVMAGDPSDETKILILVKVPKAVDADAVDAIVNAATAFIALNPQARDQVKLKRHKAGAKTLYEFEVQQQKDQPFFAAVPEAGVLAFATKKEPIEKAVTGKAAGLNDKLKPLVARRDAKDFLFVAVAGGKEDEGVKAGSGSLVLDKDISGSATITFTTPAKAKEAAEKMNDSLSSFADTIKGFLGDRAKEVQPVLEKMNASANGATVTGQFTVPGAVIEKLLAKDKEE